MARASVLISTALILAAVGAPCAAEPVNLSVRFAWEPVGVREIVTDRGFTVRLEAAEVANAGFALIPCDEQSRRGAENVVRIGHFSGALPNQLPIEKRESAIEKAPFAIDDFDPPDLAYCQAHTVLGAASGAFSLTVRGAFRAPGEETWRPLTLATPEAFGAFVDLVAPDGVPFRGHVGAYRTLVVTRPASGWFDGLDLANASGVAIGRAMLRRIATGTRVTLVP